jgi:murein L,D-transpeptidase YcbB/YkuD
LEGALNTYAKIYQAGGWPSIPVRKRPVKHGSRDTLVSAIKKRLSFTGQYNANDTSSLFTDSLLHAVKRAQTSFGLAATGVVDTVLVKQLNIPVEERMKQMSINLERMRWMPEVTENRLLVNIPEYKLHVVENNTEVMQMNIVVGKTANSTVIFSDMLKYIVFSPYWNIPESIVINEVQPAMRRDANYLSKNNMEITGYSNGLPLIRQKQGRSNALGKVKFIFPNRYNIYLHDTPSKGLFSRQNRAFSHGCIRVSQPFELAKYLLRDDSTWTSQKINEAMNQQAERWVSLAEPMPVFLVYFTAWVNADGMLQFRDDIYGHDQRMKEHLFK